MKRRQKRQLVRRYKLALAVSEKLSKDARPKKPEPLPTSLWDALVSVRRQFRRAQAMGFVAAADRLRRKEMALLERLRGQLSSLLEQPEQPAGCECNDKLHELIADLNGLETEFGDIELNVKRQTVAVTTDPIELDGVELGRFRIHLQLRYLGQSHPYRVIALDPTSAGSCDETTHPHVQSESLCEGDGYLAIKQALAEGRLYDFFLIVAQILQTYNPDSAYVRLEDWFGRECRDCGASIDPHDICRCCRCDAEHCDRCGAYCPECSRDVCDDCSARCESCDERHCDACLSKCRSCGESYCSNCLSGETCDDCTEENEAAEVPAADTKTQEASNTVAVQPHGLGETAVSA